MQEETLLRTSKTGNIKIRPAAILEKIRILERLRGFM